MLNPNVQLDDTARMKLIYPRVPIRAIPAIWEGMNAAASLRQMSPDTLLVCRHCGSSALEIRESEDGKLAYRCLSCSRHMESITAKQPGKPERRIAR